MTQDIEIKRESMLKTLLVDDNWEVVDCIDFFVFVFDRMPKTMRIVVDLRINNYSVEDIARTLKITTQAVKKRLYRAKRMLLRPYLCESRLF